MKTEVIVYLLQSDKINIKTIDKVFNSISFSEQQKLKVLAEFYKRRKNISSRAEECYNVSNKLLKSFLMSSKYQLTRNKISEEDLKFFFSQMKENYTLYRYVLYKIISILDEQQLIRMLIIIPHFKENEWFIII
ncbi:hypothetical protein, partial [Vibrio breoganii]|uniref:hypothetical protein n=1 Tax=Vibrio breoganii TaxID=553239 RepID=UPI001055F594